MTDAPGDEQPPYQPPPPPPYGPPAYQQPGYGPPGYSQPGYGPYGEPRYVVAPDHPQATTSMILGILSLVCCQVLAPVAWVLGGRAVREIDASMGRLGGRGQAQAGRVLGIIGTVVLVLTAIYLVIMLGLLFSGEFDDPSIYYENT